VILSSPSWYNIAKIFTAMAMCVITGCRPESMMPVKLAGVFVSESGSVLAVQPGNTALLVMKTDQDEAGYALRYPRWVSLRKTHELAYVISSPADCSRLVSKIVFSDTGDLVKVTMRPTGTVWTFKKKPPRPRISLWPKKQNSARSSQ
jgi:hypothetical protein